MGNPSTGDAAGGLLLIAAGAALYLLPAAVAIFRAHHNLPALVALNLLLGWTLVGWVAALVWALARPVEFRPAANPAAPAPKLPDDGRQPCPRCAEPILRAARVCRFCGAELATAWATPTTKASERGAKPAPIAAWKMPEGGGFSYWDRPREDGP